MIAEEQGAADSRPPTNGKRDGWEAADCNPDLHFFNPYAETQQSENRLPHWQQNGAVYFLTFRLADALPAKLQQDWRYERQIWIDLHPLPWTDDVEREYHTKFSGTIEKWLDAGHGSCILRQPDCASIVDAALRHFDGERLRLISSVVMPNHVHAVLVQNPECSIKKLLQNWKSYTSHKINAILARSGILWQKDYFDRLVRDEQHLANCVRYIRGNPLRAGLHPKHVILYESSLAKQID